MKKEQIEIIITSVLIIGLIFSVSGVLKKTKGGVPQRRPLEAVAVSQVQPALNVASAGASFKDLEERAEKLEWARDPFSHRAASLIGRTGELKLDGIVWDKENPKTVIDGVILGIGEKIGDYTVIGITQDSVTLTDGTNEIKLRL